MGTAAATHRIAALLYHGNARGNLKRLKRLHVLFVGLPDDHMLRYDTGPENVIKRNYLIWKV